MMGINQPQDELFSYQVNLEKRVRPNHPLRRVSKAVDFTFVRAEVAQFYGKKGNVGIDPVVLVKLMFLLFFDNITSERELMEIVPERLDYLWFLGYGLNDEIPNHSVLSKARRRWGKRVFELVFVRTVQQCVEAGLVDGRKLHVDSSLIVANASKDSVVESCPELVDALKRAYQKVEEKLEEQAEERPPEPENKAEPEPKPANGPASSQATAERKGSRTLSKTQSAGPINKRLVSLSDPEATLARKPGEASRLRYHHHRALDDKHGVITAAQTTTGNVSESHKLMDLVEQHQKNTNATLQTVVADKKYGTIDNYVACQKLGLSTHLGDLLATQKNSPQRQGIFEARDFVFQPQTNTYLCPAGQVLKARRVDSLGEQWKYEAPAEICAQCALRSKCTRARQGGRTLLRHVEQELVDLARAQARSPQARRDRRRRQHLVERSFAESANEHGFKRSRWRGLWKQEIQDYLIASVQNLRILLTKTSGRTTGAQSQKIVQLEQEPTRPPFFPLKPLQRLRQAIQNRWSTGKGFFPVCLSTPEKGCWSLFCT
jgi:transposase